MAVCKANVEHLHSFRPPASGTLEQAVAVLPARARSAARCFPPLQLSSAVLQELQEENVTSWLEDLSETTAQGTPGPALKFFC